MLVAKFGHDDNDESPPLRTAAAGAPDHHDSDDDSDDKDDKDNKRHKPAGGKKGPKNSHQSSTDTPKSNSGEKSRILRSSFSSQTETRGIALASILHADQNSLVWPHEFLEMPFEQLKAATNGFNSSLVTEGGCLLGSGSFGDVYLGLLSLRDKPCLVAVKKFKPVLNKTDKLHIFFLSFSLLA